VANRKRRQNWVAKTNPPTNPNREEYSKASIYLCEKEELIVENERKSRIVGFGTEKEKTPSLKKVTRNYQRGTAELSIILAGRGL